MINEKGSLKEEVKHCVGCESGEKWQDVSSGIIFDDDVYRFKNTSMFIPSSYQCWGMELNNGSDTWALRKADQNLLDRTDMIMLRWMLGNKEH